MNGEATRYTNPIASIRRNTPAVKPSVDVEVLTTRAVARRKSWSERGASNELVHTTINFGDGCDGLCDTGGGLQEAVDFSIHFDY